jgi:hypothetical protein
MMPTEIRVNVPDFWDQGYLLVRNVFSKAEVEDFRRHTFANRQRKGDLLCHPQLRNVILDDRVLSIARQILGDTPVYYGDSTANIGQQSFEFHKDNPDRLDGKAPDWKGRYTQIRFGLYLQDHALHSGGLRLIPGSHNAVSNPFSKKMNVRTRVGDLVVWNLRTDHAGAAMMLRFLPWFYAEQRQNSRWNSRSLVRLNTRFPLVVPRFLIADEGLERAAIFFSMGRDDAHLERYLSYLKTRMYMIEVWKNSEYGPDVWEAVRDKHIKVIDVGDEVRQRLAAGDTSLGVNKGYVAIPY